MPLKSEKNACLFGSLFRNYLPLHPISQLKALIISVFITIQGFDKTMFREEITVEGQSRIVLTKTVPHEICKMDFCCITNKFLDFFLLFLEWQIAVLIELLIKIERKINFQIFRISFIILVGSQKNSVKSSLFSCFLLNLKLLNFSQWTNLILCIIYLATELLSTLNSNCSILKNEAKLFPLICCLFHITYRPLLLLEGKVSLSFHLFSLSASISFSSGK